MKHFFLLGMIAAALPLAAAENFAAKLPKLPGKPLSAGWNAPGAASEQDGTWRVCGVQTGVSVHYVSVRVPFNGDLTGKALAFTGRSDTPAEVPAFYLRGFDKQGKCILSWKNWSSPLAKTGREFVLVPESNVQSFTWEPFMIKGTGTELAKLEFIIGSRSVGKVYSAEFSNIRLVKAPPAPKKIPVQKSAAVSLSSNGFEILGIPGNSAELRGSLVWFTEDKKHLLLTRAQDHGPHGYLLLTDLDTGKTTQYFNPPQVRQGDQFGSLLTSKGIFLYDQGGAHLLAFDMQTRQTRYLGRPEPRAVHFMVYTEAPDGTVYIGGYPQATITAWNPVTGKFRNYGRMDPKEQYLNMIATDKNGYVYCGIGTARANLIALDPKTGKITQIIPEKMRGLGSGMAYSGDDGYAYLMFGKFSAKLLDGKVVATGVVCPGKRRILSAKYGERIWDFPDGARVKDFSLDKRTIDYLDAEGKSHQYKFDYKSGGLEITSMGGNAGRIFGSTCHPLHFVEYDPQTGKLLDHGAQPGGNYCNFTAHKGISYMCEYAGGRMWKFDPAKPVQRKSNVYASLGIGTRQLFDIGKAKNGHFTLLANDGILLCFGEKEGAEFTFPLKAEKNGRYYLNLFCYEHLCYGTAELSFNGKTEKLNLQNLVDRTREFAMGPLDLKAGTHVLKFTVRSNGGSSRPMCGILSAELGKKPFTQAQVNTIPDNPQMIGAWPLLVTRPRAINVHPNGREVVMAGYAGYGLCGGGFGICDISTGKVSEVRDWMPGHSCIAFRFDANGDVLGGTDVSAPGGGYVQATEAALFRLDWKTKKVVKSRILSGVSHVMSVELWNGKMYAALPDGRLLVVNPQTLEIEKTLDSDGLGWAGRNALQKTPDNRLFYSQTNAISELHPKTGAKVPRVKPLEPVTTGGAVVGDYLYVACHRKYARWKIPAPLK